MMKSAAPSSQTYPSSPNMSAQHTLQIAEEEPPEGGYGWWVVVGGAILTWWYAGTSYSWGVLQAALVDEGLSSPSTLAFVGSLTTACISAFGVINARLIRNLGARVTAVIGVLLLGLGQVLSGFTTMNIGGLFMTSGFMGGVGTSLLFLVGTVTPAQYFKSKRGLANGIVSTGAGLGGTVLSFAFNGLVLRVGIAWTFRIVGFMILGTGLPAAWLMKERTPIGTVLTIDWRLFRDLRFSMLFAAGSVALFPLFVPPFFLPLYSKALGLSSTAGAGFVAAFSFSSACGRLLGGFFCDRIGPINSLLLALVLCALSMMVIWPVATSLGPLIFFVVVNGIANGGFFASMPTVVGNTFGLSRVSVAMGMIVTGWIGGYLLGAPIAGYILKAAGDGGKSYKQIDAYHPAIFYAGSMAIIAAALVIFLRLKTERKIFVKL